jgi:soluble lytic murein transglycosylase
VALAGYNAGPNAARRWLPSQSIDPDIWVENIPYNETRGYVQRVLWHSVVFAWLRSGEPQRTESWLARIAPAPQSIVLSRD